MTAPARSRRWVPAVVLLALAALMLPAAVAAHASLTGSDPANGATVSGPLAGPVVLAFSEALQSGSHAELLVPGGTKLADASIDASNRARMVFALAAPLQPGTYTVQWTSVAADKDVARGQVTFSVAAATPALATQTSVPATAAATLATTAAPTTVASTAPSVAPAITPSPAPDDAPTASAADAMIAVIAALALVAVVAFILLRRGRGAA